MSDIPTDYRDRLDLRAIIARIDRDRAEALKLQEEREKFIAEQRNLLAESLKFGDERGKLIAESLKLGRDRLLAPWLAIVGLIGGIITVASAIARWKGWGG